MGRLLFVIILLTLGVCLGIGALAFISAGEIYDYKDTFKKANPPDVDVILCLAGGRGRIKAASELWAVYESRYQQASLASRKSKSQTIVPIPPKKPPVLYVSGMGSQANWGVFAQQVRSELMKALKPEYVVLETESTNTTENMKIFTERAKSKQWKSYLLVTSSYHMKRSKYLMIKTLKKSQFPTDPDPTIHTMTVYQPPFGPEQWKTTVNGIEVTVMEYLKWMYYRTFWLP